MMLLIELLFSLTWAESEGFEPPDQLPGHRISSAARSTTPATFLWALKEAAVKQPL